MPSTRDMDKPDGLLTILRLAIMANKKMLAYTIARRCSQEKSIYFSMYCDFMMRILLEDKFPHGKQYFSTLRKEKQNFKKNVMSNGNTDLRTKDQKYADIAYSIASLDTNHSVFEETFNVLYQYVYEHKYTTSYVELKGENFQNTSISEFQQKKYDNSSICLMMTMSEYVVIKKAVYRDYSDDKLYLENKTPKEVTSEETQCWSNDHALREFYLARAKGYKSTYKVTSLPAIMSQRTIDDAFEAIKDNKILKDYNAALFKKRTSDGCTKLFDYLYPHAQNECFKTNMKKYLHTEGYTHYVGTTLNRRASVLKHLRYLARCKSSRLKHVNVAEKQYSINYLSFDSKGWKVQLMAPDKSENSTEKTSMYPYLLQQYKISYPCCAGEDEKSSSTVEIEIGEHARVEQSFNVRKENNCFKFESNKLVNNEKFSLDNLKSDLNGDEDDKRLALLQILIYRYDKDYRTTLSDIRYEKNYTDSSNGTQTFMIYSLNNNTKRKPNRSHPDIWHQLLYYQVPRTKQQRAHSNSYVAKIIDTLQSFLAEKGHKNREGDYMKFFKWLKKYNKQHVEEFGNKYKTQHGLWWRLIDSLDKEVRSPGRYPNREGNLQIHFPLNDKGEGCPYIRDEFVIKNV